MFNYRVLRAIGVAALAFLWTGCRPTLTSQWRQAAIVVDGDDAEWAGHKSFLEKHNLEFGIFNDADHLYLCFVLTDPVRQMQVARSGFSVWLDGEGGKDRNFGVRYPLGLAERFAPASDESQRPDGGMRDRRGMRCSRGSEERPQSGRASIDPEQLARMMERVLTDRDFEILGPLPGQRMRTSGADVPVEVAAAWSQGRLVYELKIPLSRGAGRVVGIGARSDKPIGLGLVAPVPDMARAAQRRTSFPGSLKRRRSSGEASWARSAPSARAAERRTGPSLSFNALISAGTACSAISRLPRP